MRIAYLCKRQYMHKDVIVDRYARLYEQPYQLALRGHQMLGLCPSYRPTDERSEVHEAGPGSLGWRGFSPGRSRLGLLAAPVRAESELRRFAPDLIVAASDGPHVVLGAWLARRLNAPFAADLYDNFDSFGLTRLPGLSSLYRRALRDAAVVSCVSEPLSALVKDGYGAKGLVITLPSTINRNLFYPRNKQACRRKLSLPIDAKLIGTAGGLSEDKGIAAVYRAWERLSSKNPALHLVLAGGVDPDCLPPKGARVHYLGRLDHTCIGDLFSALDVGVVYVRDTPYGRYSFPQKAYEMAACDVPMAVARVGAMENLFRNAPQCLYTPDDAISLAATIEEQLRRPCVADFPIPDWAELAAEMEGAYLQAVE